MVVGKLSILLVTSPVSASDIHNPRFFEFSSGPFVNRLATLTFGWFKTLDDDQMEAYQQSLIHAAMISENGQTVTWYRRDASGSAVPVYTWPTGSGYCRRIHVQTIAYSMQKTQAVTACYDTAHDNWRWISDK